MDHEVKPDTQEFSVPPQDGLDPKPVERHIAIAFRDEFIKAHGLRNEFLHALANPTPLSSNEAALPQNRTKPTPIIDAAIRAGCNNNTGLRDSEKCGALCPCYLQKSIHAALRATCPKEPPPEWLNRMTEAAVAARGEKEPEKFFHLWLDEMAAAYRAQPLWQELWGES